MVELNEGCSAGPSCGSGNAAAASLPAPSARLALDAAERALPRNEPSYNASNAGCDVAPETDRTASCGGPATTDKQRANAAPTNTGSASPTRPSLDEVALLIKLHKRLRQHDALTAGAKPVYERIRRRGSDGRTSITTTGCPFVWHPDFGLFAPVDDEDAMRSDAWYRKEDLTYVESGDHVSVTRLWRMPRRLRDRRTAWQAAGISSAETPLDRRLATAASLSGATPFQAGNTVSEAMNNTVVPVRIGIRDREPLPRLPSRSICGAAFTIHGRPDVLSPIRAERLKRRVEMRRAWGRELIGWVIAAGGRPAGHCTRRLHLLQAYVPANRLTELAARTDVVSLARWNDGRAAVDRPTTYYECNGAPRAAENLGVDTASCSTGELYESSPAGPVHFWEDARASALAAWPYIDQRYDGAGFNADGGLAAWAVGKEYEYGGGVETIAFTSPHLVLMVIDNGDAPYVDHPAFYTAFGEMRVKFWIDDPGYTSDSWGYVSGGSNVRAAADSPWGSHGTSTAGVAMGNVTDGQDSRLAGTSRCPSVGCPGTDWGYGTESDREIDGLQARSGLARRAFGVFSGTSLLASLDAIGEYEAVTGETSDGAINSLLTSVRQVPGVDVIAQSENLNSSNHFFRHSSSAQCPTPEQTWGTDDDSVMLTSVFLDDGVLFVKSAGNQHYESGGSAALCPDPYEIGAPGASPVALTVGAAAWWWGDASGSYRHASDVQQAANLYSMSSGATLQWGRTYPSLVAPHFACGSANAYLSNPEELFNPMSHEEAEITTGYGKHYATSSAAPAVAGAAILFKHWYLANHGPDVANSPGRLMSNLLNMADGYVTDQHRATGATRGHPPLPWWGLGRFRMRFYESGYLSGSFFRATTTVVLGPGAGGDTISLGYAPRETRRLVITLWWLDVNTGPGEDDLEVAAWLTIPFGEYRDVSYYRQSNGDNRIRMQFDCYDSEFDSPPTGPLRLLVMTYSDVAEAVRYPNNSTRTVYVSWYWEGGKDASLIECGSSATDECPERDEPMFGTYAGGHAVMIHNQGFAPNAEQLGAAVRCVEESIQVQFRVASNGAVGVVAHDSLV